MPEVISLLPEAVKSSTESMAVKSLPAAEMAVTDVGPLRLLKIGRQKWNFSDG